MSAAFKKDLLIMLASWFDRIELPYLKILTKNDFSPWSLFSGNDKVSSCMTSGEPGSKKNKEIKIH